MAYPGGKGGSGVYQAIINQMPPHRVYIEPFLGAGSVLRFKKRAPAGSIGIDIDAAVTEAWNGDEVPGLQIIQADALCWLASTTFTDDTLIYLDPPYLMHTRSCKRRVYRYEFELPGHHQQLLDIIKGLPCMVMISGYYSELYAQELTGWRSIHFSAQTRGGHSAVEWLWMNFPEPVELHDYQFLGTNFRERERIKRKRLRWQARLKRMPAIERYALLSALKDFRSTTP
jgi:DNA adenine methylase